MPVSANPSRINPLQDDPGDSRNHLLLTLNLLISAVARRMTLRKGGFVIVPADQAHALQTRGSARREKRGLSDCEAIGDGMLRMAAGDGSERITTCGVVAAAAHLETHIFRQKLSRAGLILRLGDVHRPGSPPLPCDLAEDMTPGRCQRLRCLFSVQPGEHRPGIGRVAALPPGTRRRAFARYAVLHQSYDAAAGIFKMSTVRKTITLTDAQDDRIKAQVASGDYTNDSEYLRDLIRREQEKTSALKAAIDEGLASGPSNRSLDDIWAAAESRYRASNG